MKTTSTIRLLLTTSLVAFACGVAAAQCESCDVGYDSGCRGGACEGRCQYCVDGECIPNRTTYGYYQTNWRRWPVSAPVVPERPRRRRQGPPVRPGEVDLPSPMDEGSARPEFPRTRKTGNGKESEMERSFSMPMNGMPQTIEPDSIDVDAMPNVESPNDDMGAALFDGASLENIARDSVRQVSAVTEPIPTAAIQTGNPLRTLGASSVRTSGTIPTRSDSRARVAPRRLRPAVTSPKPLSAKPTDNASGSNPLR